MVGIELFSGVGGMSIGAKLAGVNVKVAIEIDSKAANTYLHNHPSTQVINKDIREVKSIEIERHEPIVLFGGPPCQGFSRSNLRTRNSENLNNWLFEEFIRMAKLLNPEWVVIENVRGLLETSKGIFLKNIILSLEHLGYNVNYKILNAMHFGVPQNRERLFIVGSPKKKKFNFPSPFQTEYITVKEAISDLPILQNGNKNISLDYRLLANNSYSENLRELTSQSHNNGVSKNNDLVLERYLHIPQGGNWKNIPNKLLNNYKDVTRCHTGIYYRLDENKPSLVIGNYRKNMLIHPMENRGLSVREAARLQSFPDNFEFKGNLVDQQQHVGNAVPPLLAKKVFESILDLN